MNRPKYVTPERIEHFIKESLLEDIGLGDYSTLSSVPAHTLSKAKLLVKQDCILAGIELACEIFRYYDNMLNIDLLKKDGNAAKVGEVAFIVSGKAQSILSVERFVLNCMQRMSGVATSAHQAARYLEGTNTTLLDTRKTTPCFRMCEKWAVHIGGVTNHRYGLYDMIMLKDNHVDYAGGVIQAIENAQKYVKDNNLDIKIEVETRNIDEVKQALSTGAVDIIMLDNMSLEEMTEAVKIIGGRVKTEASGGIVQQELARIATTGVDYISSGAIVYNPSIVDLSLKAF